MQMQKRMFVILTAVLVLGAATLLRRLIAR